MNAGMKRGMSRRNLHLAPFPNRPETFWRAFSPEDKRFNDSFAFVVSNADVRSRGEYRE